MIQFQQLGTEHRHKLGVAPCLKRYPEMKPSRKILILTGAVALLSSCEDEGSPVTVNNFGSDRSLDCSCGKGIEGGYYSESKYGEFAEGEYTEWMNFPELQKFMDDFDGSTDWMYRSEGRDYKGLSQYRYAIRKKPDDASGSRVHSGRSSDDFKSLGIKYIRDGFELVSLQLFQDSSGVTRHQAVWFKYKADSAERAAAPDSSPSTAPQVDEE